MRVFILRFTLITIIILISGFSVVQRVEALGSQKSLKITYPYNKALFPLDFAAPTFRWKDDSKTAQWQVMIKFRDKGKSVSAKVNEPEWQPEADLWKSIKKRSKGKHFSFKVRGMGNAGSKVFSETNIIVHISKDSVKAPIFYRDVPLPASLATRKLKSIVWRLGEVSSNKLPPAVLSNLPACGNCHSFSADGKLFAMDVDFGNDKGAYIISEMKQEIVFEKDKLISWSDYKKKDGQRTYGLLSQISPDGSYVISTVKDFSIFKYYQDVANSQLFFPVRGILAVYDRSTKKIFSLPGADNPKYVQTNPVWSPDGKWIIFARANAIKEDDVKALLPEFYYRKKAFRYDLYRIPFNNGNGGKAEPLPGASNNGKSNYFPKFSHDGKWIVFCQADSFMLHQPDSKLYIMPAKGGTPRLMKSNSENGMNSWHSWSPDSKWLIFSSKATGPYTRLWLTHIDEQGNDTPPVMLENFVLPDRAVNIPEFVNVPAGTSFKIRDKLHN